MNDPARVALYVVSGVLVAGGLAYLFFSAPASKPPVPAPPPGSIYTPIPNAAPWPSTPSTPA